MLLSSLGGAVGSSVGRGPGSMVLGVNWTLELGAWSRIGTSGGRTEVDPLSFPGG